MFAEEVISKAIPPINSTDTVQKALNRLAEYKLKHIPVLKNGQFIGLALEDELLTIKNFDIALEQSSLTMLNAFVLNNVHFYDVIRVMNQLNLTAVAVLDQHKNYLGMISINHIIGFVASQFAVNEPGGIIVLEIQNFDNSLAHIAQVVEADNAQILSSYVKSFTDSTRLEITIKVNKTEITSLIASFERYNYQVKEVFNNTQSDNGTQDRYDSLMNYLNV
jgi:acetoin utilization protein AcuB